MAIKIPRGTQDLLPEQTAVWRWIENTAHVVSRLYNYKEIRTPMFEATELFQRGVGDTTDIVQKEMYTFTDRGNRSLTLRPEGTAPVVRSFVENKMFGAPDQPVKLYYIGSMFRYERPQAGRFRQFNQFGVEALGSADPLIDAEVISLALDFYKKLGLKQLKTVINTLGDTESRQAHREALIAHFEPEIDSFCSDCQTRLEKNPLRILDCKVDRDHPLMGSAPSIHDYLNEASKAYFDRVKEALDAMDVDYDVDPRLVRGLDYYNHTAFEIMGASFGAITTLTGGGRYNGLVEELGGPETPGIGFGLSIERVLLAMEAEGITAITEEPLDCFIATIGEEAAQASASILKKLRDSGLAADRDYMDRKMKGQFKQADRLNARTVAVLGDEELSKGVINLKDMKEGTQKEIQISSLAETIEQIKREEE